MRHFVAFSRDKSIIREWCLFHDITTFPGIFAQSHAFENVNLIDKYCFNVTTFYTKRKTDVVNEEQSSGCQTVTDAVNALLTGSCRCSMMTVVLTHCHSVANKIGQKENTQITDQTIR
jgi:hypothetical protein